MTTIVTGGAAEALCPPAEDRFPAPLLEGHAGLQRQHHGAGQVLREDRQRVLPLCQAFPKVGFGHRERHLYFFICCIVLYRNPKGLTKSTGS